ncbi:MAG: Arc family DNA-binding protein [Cetobacterium sp.]
MVKKEDLVRITLRLPKETWEKLKKEAELNHRSLNSEILTKIKKK